MSRTCVRTIPSARFRATQSSSASGRKRATAVAVVAAVEWRTSSCGPDDRLRTAFEWANVTFGAERSIDASPRRDRWAGRAWRQPGHSHGDPAWELYHQLLKCGITQS